MHIKFGNMHIKFGNMHFWHERLLKGVTSSVSSDSICFLSLCLIFYQKCCVLFWFFFQVIKRFIWAVKKKKNPLCIWWNRKGGFVLTRKCISNVNFFQWFNDFKKYYLFAVFKCKIRLGHYCLLSQHVCNSRAQW